MPDNRGAVMAIINDTNIERGDFCADWRAILRVSDWRAP